MSEDPKWSAEYSDELSALTQKYLKIAVTEGAGEADINRIFASTLMMEACHFCRNFTLQLFLQFAAKAFNIYKRVMQQS